jgi:hypothetical protein
VFWLYGAKVGASSGKDMALPTGKERSSEAARYQQLRHQFERTANKAE